MFELQHVWYGAVVTIINAWHEQGKKRTNDTRHDFREWGQIMDWIVQNIFQAAPLMDNHMEAKERAASPQLTFLRSLAIAVHEDHRLNQSLTATQLVNLCIEREIEIPGLSHEKEGEVEAGRKQFGVVLAKLFGEKNEIVMEDFKLAKLEENGLNDQGNPTVLKKYTFSILAKNPPTSTP